MIKSFIQNLHEGLYDPGIFKAFFLAGGPGSGKSFVTSSAFTGTGLKLVNSDVKFERDLKKANLSLKMPDEEEYFRNIIRQSAKKFVISQLDQYIKGRLGLVIDSTGRDYDMIARQHNILKNMGYDCYMVFVSTSLETAMERNNKRKERSLHDKVVERSWKQVMGNKKLYKSLFRGNFVEVSTEGPEKDNLPSGVQSGISKFLNKSPKNSIAKKWLKAARELL